jgi:hypothetical protein
MIEYYLNTGIILDADNFYKLGVFANGQSFIDSIDQFSNHIYLNGQSLVEDDYVENKEAGRLLSVNHSGDFYFKSGNILFSGLPYNLSGINNLHYDIIPSGKRLFFESDNFNNLLNGFSNQVAGQISGESFFINGIKLISGIHYYVHDGIFEWDDGNPTSLEFGGIMFSMPNLNQKIITGQYDIYDEYFKKGTTQAYLNGVKLYQEEFLETCKNVSLIQTGIEPEIEFSKQSIETIIFF